MGRDMTKPPRSGPGGRVFESLCSDQLIKLGSLDKNNVGVSPNRSHLKISLTITFWNRLASDRWSR